MSDFPFFNNNLNKLIGTLIIGMSIKLFCLQGIAYFPYGGDVSGGVGFSSNPLPDELNRVNHINFQKKILGLHKRPNPERDGRGQTVLVIDSGLSPFSPDRQYLVSFVDYLGNCTKEDPCDDNSHGTSIVNLIRQVAPGVSIAVARVLNQDLESSIDRIIAALDWGIENRSKYNITCINLSLFSETRQFGSHNPNDELIRLIKKATDRGISVITSTMNNGSRQQALPFTPVNSPHAITVGSVYHGYSEHPEDHEISDFTDIGWVMPPTQIDRIRFGEFELFRSVTINHVYTILKPDVFTFGEHLMVYTDDQQKDPSENPYTMVSGTSYSAALVTGAVVLIKQKHSRFSPREIKVFLQNQTKESPPTINEISADPHDSKLQILTIGTLRDFSNF